MKRIVFFLCLLFYGNAHTNGQCIGCTELHPLTNGNFSTFIGPSSILTAPCLNPTPGHGSGSTVNTYFSNSNLPGWQRIKGAPHAGTGYLVLHTFDEGGGHWCRTVGTQGISTNFPFLANGQYEVVINFAEWYNRCNGTTNVSLGAVATTGLLEAATPSDYVDNPSTPPSVSFPSGFFAFSNWFPDIGHWERDPSSISLCGGPLSSNFDQLFIGVGQNAVETYPTGHSYAGQPRGFTCEVSSIQVKLCNDCPNTIYTINSSSSPDPITLAPLSSGGLFIDAGIDISGAPVFGNNSNINTMLVAKWIEVNRLYSPGHAFLAKADNGKFFEMVPNISCPELNPCGPITGPETLMCSHIFLNASPSGGVWSSSNTSIATISSIGEVAQTYTGLTPTTVVITYTKGNCVLSKTITVMPCAKPGRGADEPIIARKALSIIPNPNTGTFTLTGQLPCADACVVKIEVTDVLGKTIYTEKTNVDNGKLNMRINLAADIANGVYLVRVKNNDISEVIRFTLTR